MGSYQIVRSKMEKTGVLLADKELARYIPKTVPFTIKNLHAMLREFSRVYVKPDCGRGGERVILIVSHDGGGYEIYYETTMKNVERRAAAARFIHKVAAGDQFIVQQGIALLRSDGIPFDLRVNVQKPYEKWAVTAMIAKMMAPGKVVTNYCQGSTLIEFEEGLLKAGLGKKKTRQVKELLTHIGERAAFVLNEKYKGLRELGLDIALDSKAQPWILEVNTKPKYPRGLSNKFDRYRRIIKRTYG